DIEMPVMDGLTALPEILKIAPKTKVIMFSSLTAKGADITIKALALGAVECIVKPSGAEASGENSPFKVSLINIVKSLAPKKHVAPSRFSAKKLSPDRQKTDGTTTHRLARQPSTLATSKSFELRKDISVYTGLPDILAIGSSTGGPKALFKVLKDIGPLHIPIVITQHMPATFTKILADHITQQTGLPTLEGEEGMVVQAGKVYVAPGDKHMLFERKNIHLTIKLNDGPEENFCKPSVDPMLRSLVEIYGKKVLCIILTGMGHDGLNGSQVLAKAKGRIIAQDEETSVVWGMPGAVAMAGICSAVLPLQKIGVWIKKNCR
ncbi:MAG: chemotaxis-specific protein-glutamate methyltransferase CheB, partial [Alphaproteobacteria bacterium]|nr:chemotaxis-specific protein-glutamate methyltransferase CheB [Alphaproteobacteria bacterium]